MYKYDLEHNRWFNCNPMQYGHAGSSFYCISNQYSTNIYAFGGSDNPDLSKVIERYNSFLDIWITLTYKIPNSFLYSGIKTFTYLESNDENSLLLFGGG